MRPLGQALIGLVSLCSHIWAHGEAPDTHPHGGKAMWTAQRGGAICKPRREVSKETKPAPTLAPAFLPAS